MLSESTAADGPVPGRETALSGSGMGISRKQLTTNRLGRINQTSAFHFGTTCMEAILGKGEVIAGNRFPYQELSKSVPVWHATCN